MSHDDGRWKKRNWRARAVGRGERSAQRRSQPETRRGLVQLALDAIPSRARLPPVGSPSAGLSPFRRVLMPTPA